MNNKRKRFLIAGILIVALVVIGSVIFSAYKTNKNETVIVKENVKVITSETPAEYQLLDINDESLTFDDVVEYNIGDVIVSGITEKAPKGFIRRIIEKKHSDGRYVYITEPATLLDVFEEAHIVKSFALSENNVTERDYKKSDNILKLSKLPRADLQSINLKNLSYNTAPNIINLSDDRELLFKGNIDIDIDDNLSVSGEVGFDSWFELKIDIKNENILFGIISHTKTEGEISIGCEGELFEDDEGEFSKNIYSKKLPAIQFNVGVVPIVITNDFSADLEGELDIEGAIKTSTGFDNIRSVGFEYNSKTGIIEEINEKKYNSDGMQWETKAEASGSAEIGVYASLTTQLYGACGADLSAGLAGEISGEISTVFKDNGTFENYGSLEMGIYPKAQGSIVVSVPVIDKKLAESPILEVSFPALWENEWSSSTLSVKKGSKISLLIFEMDNSFVDLPKDISSLVWWKNYYENENYYSDEDSAIRELTENQKVAWLSTNNGSDTKNHNLEQYNFDNVKLTYLEQTYDGKKDINCRVITSSWDEWEDTTANAFVNIYIDEKYYTTVRYSDVLAYNCNYVWDICKVKDGFFKVTNKSTFLSMGKNYVEPIYEGIGKVNDIELFKEYGDKVTLSIKTTNKKFYLSGCFGDKTIELEDVALSSQPLCLNNKNNKIAQIFTLDYAHLLENEIEAVDVINSNFKNSNKMYFTKTSDEINCNSDNCTYYYVVDENGKVLPIILGKIYCGEDVLHPVVKLNSSNFTEADIEDILSAIKWNCYQPKDIYSVSWEGYEPISYEIVDNENLEYTKDFLLVTSHLDCDKLTLFATEKMDVQFYSDDNYTIKGAQIISPTLTVEKEKYKATICITDYDCKDIRFLNGKYMNENTGYSEEYISGNDECFYTYLLGSDGNILPIVKGNLYIGSIVLYPIIELEGDSIPQKALEEIISNIKWEYEWSLN